MIERLLARRSLLIAGGLACLLPSARSDSQGHIRLLLPFSAGSATDVSARILAEPLSRLLGSTVVVENLPGAVAVIAAQALIRAPKDGRTLMLGTNTSHSAAPSLFRNLPYNPLTDFEPLARLYFLPLLLVTRPGLPASTAGELLVLSRQGKPLTYAWPHSTARVAGETLRVAGGSFIGIPYRANSQALTDMMGGVVDFGFVDYATAQPLAQAGRLKILGVTSAEPSLLTPAIPSIAASVPGFDIVSWAGAFAPAGIPRETADHLTRAFVDLMKLPELAQHLLELGYSPAPLGGEPFREFLREQVESWRVKIKAAGIEQE